MHAAQVRRDQELRRLALLGVPLRTFGKSGHWTLGSLHLFTASGRWLNEHTGRRGRLNGESMSRILEREYFQQLCPQATAASDRMQALYQEHEEFTVRGMQQSDRYNQFMAEAKAQKPPKFSYYIPRIP